MRIDVVAASIPVQVRSEAREAHHDSARALLHEVQGLLEALVHRGEAAGIDLHHLPLSPEDRAMLVEMLGSGAVFARVEAAGVTEVHETAFPGVWWVTHASESGEVLAEFIDVCAVPEILRACREDSQEGLERLGLTLNGARA